MKRNLSNIMLIVLLLMFVSIIVRAEDVEIGGYKYELVKKAKEAILKGGGNYTGSVVIPPKVEYDGDEYNVTSIGQFAFNNCQYMTSVTIPNSVTSIGTYAFCDCI